MLCQFRFKNFASYRDDTVLDMEAANIEEFSDSLFSPPCDKFPPVLPIAAIFGPNSGGKTNVINALAYLISRVVSPVASSTGNGNPFGMVLKSYLPFWFDDDSKNQPTEFEITFRTKHAQYNYFLSIFNNKIVEESLSYIKTPCTRRRSVRLYHRDADGIELGTALRKANKDRVSASIPYLSFLSISSSFPEINEAIEWFQSCYVKNFAIAGSDHKISEMLENSELKPTFLYLLKSMDIPISDYKINVSDDGSMGEDIGEYSVTTTHDVDGKSFQLDINNESEGTIKILSTLPGILYSMAKGGLVLFDEFDAKIHPHLLRFLIDLFIDPEINRRHAQLIFTCHDISIMKNDFLRRDEIWFAALNKDSASELWSLYDIQDENGLHVKNTAAYDRQYLAGRYGGDPYLQRIKDWRVSDASET